MVYMVINTKTGKAEYVASNSPDLFVLKADASEPVALKGQGFPLGLTKNLEDTDFTHKIVHLEVGDMIIGYSDALTEEPHTTGARWLDDGFLEVLKETQECSKTNKENTRFEYIYNKFDETVVKPLTDDLTFVGITRK